MLKIGLTGGIGSGKSTAARFFDSQGIDVIDLDQLARQVVEPGSPALQEICNRFGKSVLTDEGDLNRKKLGDIVFSNRTEKDWLESLLHPLIHTAKQQVLEQSASPYVVIEIPLLAENQRQDDVDRVLVIDCDEQQQIDRAITRGQQDEAQIKKIIDIQASRNTRNALADDIIENNGSKEELLGKLQRLHEKYLRLSRQM